MATIIAGGGGRDGFFIKTMKKEDFDGIKKALFIPYAAKLGTEAVEKNYNEIRDAFAEEFGATTDMLTMSDLRQFDVLKSKVDKADAIYVGGGSTLMLMNRMRKSGLDKLLIDAYRNSDKLLCGDSAGGIIWAKYGNADSRVYKADPAKKTRVRGLGLLNVLFCPHIICDSSRRTECKRISEKLKTLPAIAMEGCAVIVRDGKYKTMKFEETGDAFRFHWEGNDYIKESLITNEYRDFTEVEKI